MVIFKHGKILSVLRRTGWSIMLLVLLISQSPLVAASGLSDAQRKLLQENINYFNLSVCGTVPVPTSSAVSGVSFDDSQSSDTGNQTTVDDDGIDPSPTNSPDHQSSTSYANGQLGALHTNYIALNPGWASANGVVLGDVAALTYNGTTIYAVYGDNHVGNTPHAEISVKAAMGLSGITDPTKVGNLSGIHYVVFPGTSSQLAGSVDQSKIDQIGAAAAGSGSPGGGAACACPDSGSGSLTGNTPAEQAFNYYVQQKGLPPIAAAGLVGNFMSESGGNTEQLDPTITNGIGAHGIAQWLGGRLTNLVNFASSNNEQEDSLQTQLDFSWQELGGPYASVLSKLTAATSPSQAADIVNSDGPPAYGGGYEGSGVAPNTREANAIKIFGEYGGGASAGPSSCSSPSGSISGYMNPLRDWTDLKANRVDQGVDYQGVGPVYAIGDGTIDVARNDTGWPGGNFVSYKLSGGPAAGKEVYVAEDCALDPNILSGKVKQVHSNTVLCTTSAAGGNIYIETGWAGPGIDNSIDEGLNLNCYDISNSTSTAFGMNFRDLMVTLKVSETNNEIDKPITCALPSGWPTTWS